MNHRQLFDELTEALCRSVGTTATRVNALEWLQMVNPHRTLQDLQHLLRKPIGRGFSRRRLKKLVDDQSMYAALEALQRIADRKEHITGYEGICQLVEQQLFSGPINFSQDFNAWPKVEWASSDWPLRCYPVPGGRKGFLQAQSELKLWDESTQQGKDRWELLRFLIDRYQTKINEYEKRRK